MDIKSLYREIVNEHNLHPSHKKDLQNPTMVLRGINPSCGDDISLQLVMKDGVIEDAAFNGSGCAVSKASADMMCDLCIGRKASEAEHLSELFMRMIRQNDLTQQEQEELDEAASLEDVAHMPARVKCATLGWRTMKQIIDDLNRNGLPDGTAAASGADACGACQVK